MTGYTEDTAPADALEALRHAQRLVRLVPTKIDRRYVTCHAVAHALLGHVPGATCNHGRCGAVEHSWLAVPGFVLDPYPVGVIAGGGPILIDAGYASPWASLYRLDAAVVRRLSEEPTRSQITALRALFDTAPRAVAP